MRLVTIKVDTLLCDRIMEEELKKRFEVGAPDEKDLLVSKIPPCNVLFMARSGC